MLSVGELKLEECLRRSTFGVLDAVGLATGLDEEGPATEDVVAECVAAEEDFEAEDLLAELEAEDLLAELEAEDLLAELVAAATSAIAAKKKTITGRRMLEVVSELNMPIGDQASPRFYTQRLSQCHLELSICIKLSIGACCACCACCARCAIYARCATCYMLTCYMLQSDMSQITSPSLMVFQSTGRGRIT